MPQCYSSRYREELWNLFPPWGGEVPGKLLRGQVRGKFQASLSFTGQEKTIHAFFHNYHPEDVFVFDSKVLLTYFVLYFALAVW